MTISYITLGCKLNYAETSTYERKLSGHGFETVPWSKLSTQGRLVAALRTTTADGECLEGRTAHPLCRSRFSPRPVTAGGDWNARPSCSRLSGAGPSHGPNCDEGNPAPAFVLGSGRYKMPYGDTDTLH